MIFYRKNRRNHAIKKKKAKKTENKDRTQADISCDIAEIPRFSIVIPETDIHSVEKKEADDEFKNSADKKTD